MFFGAQRCVVGVAMMRILVLMVEFDMVVVVNRDAKTKA